MQQAKSRESVKHRKQCGVSRSMRREKNLISILSIALLIGLAGCGSSVNTKAGPISVTDPTGVVSGQLTSLAVSGKALVSMTQVNGSTSEGVDWTVYCQGSPVTGSMSGGACGTLSPMHTPSGTASIYTAPAVIPLGSTVTITATVTSDPSATSSVTLTIVGPPISISLNSYSVETVGINGTAALSALVANDTGGAGATWTATCGSSAAGACGSFSPTNTANQEQTTYTAPAAIPPGGTAGPGTVTITATSVADPTKSASTTITIVAISVSVAPATIYVSTSGTYRRATLIATVLNDSAEQGVTWTLSCAGGTGATACGQISPTTSLSGVSVTYLGPTTAPSGGTVTITATSVADPTKSASAAVNVVSSAPITVTLGAQLPASMTVNQSSTLTATVANDTTGYGVNWTATCGIAGSCGTFTPAFNSGSGSNYTVSATYTAPATVPAGSVVTITAASAAPSGTAANPSVAATTITAVPPTIAFSQQPPASVTANAQAPVSAVVTNDTNPPGGVTWTVACNSTVAGGCGYVLPHQAASGAAATYTAPPAPPGSPVTIVASAASAPSVSVSSSLVTIQASTALSINFVPASPTQLGVGVTVNLNAAVTNDSTNAGVDWQVCASGCGFFTITPEIPAIAANPNSPYVPAVPAVTATTVTGWPNSLPIPYTAPSEVPSGGAVTISAAAHVNSHTSTVASVAISSADTGPALQGVVKAGSLPVAGASVFLYAAGTSGYGSASSLVYAPNANPDITTDANGAFTIPGGYSCPETTSEMYLVASGGQVNGTANPNLALMTALGPCGALSSSSLTINEVTTVALAWSVSRFAADPLTTGLTSYLYIGSDSGNTTGLANAFASFNNLVNPSTGQALSTVPAGNAAVPYAEINTLADILDACAVTAGGTAGDGSICGNLFNLSNPYAGDVGTLYSGVPVDTLQAAFEIVQHPAIGLGYQIDVPGLYLLASPSSPFQPILTSAPNDFSLSLNFTGGGGLSSSSTANFFTLDSSGNLWITDTSGNRVIEWNNSGAAISPATGFTASSLIRPGPIAIDSSGYLWICDGDGLTQMSSIAVAEMPGSPFSGGGLTSSCQNIAIDGAGNIWTNNTNSVSKFDEYGEPLSPAAGYMVPVSPTNDTTVSLLPPLAIDDSNNVWVGVNSSVYLDFLSLAELSGSSGIPNFLSPNPQNTFTPSNFVNTSSDSTQTQIAIDASGAIWIPVSGGNSGGLTKVPAYGGLGTTDLPGAGYSNGGGSDPLSNPRGVAVDGAGVIWVGSIGFSNTVQQSSPNLTEINPSYPSGSYSDYAASSLANRALSIAVDGVGNVWALLDNNTVTEYIGLATPAVTPTSLAVKNKKLGAKP
jgi:hypothetical protein